MQTSKRHYIYLAGNISGNLETYLWREKFESLIDEREINVVVLNPCRNRFNQKLGGFIEQGGNESDFFTEASYMEFGILPLKDRKMIEISTVIVANLALHNPMKPMIGTMFELAWADELKIPVIAIVDESTPWGKLYSLHPFINRCISARVNNVEEAIKLIDQFFVFV